MSYYVRWEIYLRDLELAVKNGTDDEAEVQSKVERILKHYEIYYSGRARDPTAATWQTGPLFWIGGWRPSLLFHVAYAEMGRELEDKLEELLEGICSSSSLAALSSHQLCLLNDLQCRVIEEENELSDRLERYHEDDEEEEEEFRHLLVEADRLRVETLRGVLDALTPYQSVEILIAAINFEIRILQAKGE